jgi:hypothetical protein
MKKFEKKNSFILFFLLTLFHLASRYSFRNVSQMLLGVFAEGQQKKVTLMGPENLNYDKFEVLLKILYLPQEEAFQ